MVYFLLESMGVLGGQRLTWILATERWTVLVLNNFIRMRIYEEGWFCRILLKSNVNWILI